MMTNCVLTKIKDWCKEKSRVMEYVNKHYIFYLRLSGVLVLKKETDTAGLLV